MDTVEATRTKHVLPPLPYPHAALEPHIDARTMLLHHGKHHASYVDNLNAALEKLPELQERTAAWLLVNPDKIPEASRKTVVNNAGGHVNHSMFWKVMSPPGTSAPSGVLADAIKRDLGGLEEFKAKFAEAGAKLFGSGWVWLARTTPDGGKLEVYTTTGHDNPMTKGHFPLLVNDVWEHAYYLKYENRRPDYLKNWWPLVNWEEVSRRFAGSAVSPEKIWEAEGGLVLAGHK